MNTTAKLGTYALVLVAALGAGAAIGAAAGPIDTGDPAPHDQHDAAPAIPTLPAGGLQVADAGFRLVAEDRLADPGPFRFSIIDAAGSPLTDFSLEHDKRLHLVVASRDLTSFDHLHPTMDDAGTWAVELPEFEPGAYRAFADFRPTDGDAVTLGIDLTVPGATTAPEPLEAAADDSVEGYDVTVNRELSTDGSTEVVVDIRRDGRPVAPDPYLGAAGHLVALRDGDLAYLHVHPVEHDGTGARFAIEVPSPGTYALFFDFAHDGAVHTARFVLEAGLSTGNPNPDTPNPPKPTPDSPDHGDTHD